MERYRDLAKLMRALAHPVRLQILAILSVKPACVGKIIELTGRRQAYISQHLALLREAGLLTCCREGLNVRYSLTKPAVMRVIQAASRYLGLELPEVRNGTSQREYLNEVWYGIPREQIEWRPMVVVERCIGCGVCAISCRRDVYAFDYDQNRPVVVAPRRCTVGCTTCATICAQDAIEFPSTGYIRQLIRQKELLRQSKDVLKANREKYDLRVRELGSI